MTDTRDDFDLDPRTFRRAFENLPPAQQLSPHKVLMAMLMALRPAHLIENLEQGRSSDLPFEQQDANWASLDFGQPATKLN